ncbi:MAG TPA: hypothetical protein EYO33_08860, partial [Phycisphaerales bacterium]|nr:hypothetical protein [Phycisphaerales bacterium]
MSNGLVCPQCQEPGRDSAHNFCTRCGLALKQPCPHCSAQLETPRDPFMTCRACDHDFWSCRACGRLYHLDRTSCVNNYCPDKGRFWTTRFGADEFHQQELEFCRNVVSTDQIPRPGWTGGATAGSDIRWPHLHTLGRISPGFLTLRA